MAAKADDLFALLDRVGNDNAQGEYLPDIVNIALADGRTCAAVTTDSPDEVQGINSRAELAPERRSGRTCGAGMPWPTGPEGSGNRVLRLRYAAGPRCGRGTECRLRSWRQGRGQMHRARQYLEGATLGEGCEVGPYARLRPGAVLKGAKVNNFVEIEGGSRRGRKGNHLTYLAMLRWARGLIRCRHHYLQLRWLFQIPDEDWRASLIGSNSALVAPVSIGADAIVAAGSTVTQDVDDGELRMERAEQAVAAGPTGSTMQ